MQNGYSIEQGHFVLTMMPSLYCDLDCPHCYLSTAERRDPTRLSNADLEIILASIDSYYDQNKVDRKTIHAYQYGGEPTSMGVEAFSQMLDTIENGLPTSKGYSVRHTILTSLVEVDLEAWAPLIKQRCGNFLQTSYDGRMRGGTYMKKWHSQMEDAAGRGMTLSTISVVNERILQEGPSTIMAYLTGLGVVEASFLPFMWNVQNDGKKYEKLAPSMDRWSEFMIAISEDWLTRRGRGEVCPEIGQLRFIQAQAETLDPVSNIAGQTLFLMPNGDYALPDYSKGWQEFMNRFASGIRKPFSEVLSSPKRKQYLRKQVLRNNNDDCWSCDHANKCVMEFWKANRPDDDCFGGKKYVQWVLENLDRIKEVDADKISTTSLY
jgi:sulfatase maturation enzyme AslB (radical SAM superfamily)